MKYILLLLIKGYQKTLSPDHGLMRFFYPHGVCRYYPSCSQYAYEAIDKRGALKGSWLAVNRVLRCNPWSQGGIDQVK